MTKEESYKRYTKILDGFRSLWMIQLLQHEFHIGNYNDENGDMEIELNICNA